MPGTRAAAGRAALGLRSALRARSLPVASALVVVVTLSAPTAFHVVHVQQLRARAAAVAHQAAILLRHVAHQRPRLWHYDADKRLRQLALLQADDAVGDILVLSTDGVHLAGTAPDSAERPQVWQSEAVVVGDQPVATVWVSAPLTPTRRTSLGLLLPFSVIGLLLGALSYLLPMRSIADAEARIERLVADLDASRDALQEANVGLEAQVESRVSELRRAHAELQATDARLRRLSAQATGLQAAERRAIARDLHDGVGQVLTGIRLNLQVLQGGAGDPTAVVGATLALVDEAIDEIRRAVDSLGPSIVDDVGLAEAVRAHCRDVSERSALPVACEVAWTAQDDAELPHAVEVAAYRMLQEALHNVIKHAGAEHAWVCLQVDAEALALRVEDDGAGLQDAGGGSGGHGLDNMRARAELLGGQLEIDTRDGGGTRMLARIPLSTTAPGPRAEPKGASPGGRG